jgi:hypothetical protein
VPLFSIPLRSRKFHFPLFGGKHFCCVALTVSLTCETVHLQIFQEKAYLVGVECKRTGGNLFGIEESLKELEQLADTAGLVVVDSTYQK